MLRVFFLITGLLIGTATIFYLFAIQENSQQEYFNTISQDKKRQLDKATIHQFIEEIGKNKSGYFFHFTSENCPYNDLGYESLISLYQIFDTEITFIVIYESEQTFEFLTKLLEKHQMPNVLLVQDNKKDIKKALNVRSLPRAVIINNDLELFYEGNYNHSSILCGFGSIDYGELALGALIKGNEPPSIDYFVLKETDCIL